MLKKIIALGMALIMCIGLFFACGNDQNLTEKLMDLYDDRIYEEEAIQELLEYSRSKNGITFMRRYSIPL